MTTPAGQIPLPGGRIGAARQLFEWCQQTRHWWRQRTRWTVSVTSTDRLYDVALRWFLEGPQDDAPPRALSARLRYGDTSSSPVPASSRTESTATVEMYYDVRQERSVRIGGHTVRVAIEKANAAPGKPGEDVGWASMLEPDVLRFSATSRAGQQAITDMLTALGTRQRERRPALYLLNSWGGWSRRDDLPQRSLDSVVLAQGQMERIRDDVQRFLDSEAAYVRRGVPWHRGYLLHGPPGTGKTSIVRALAAHFGLDLWYAPLGDLTKDANLLSLINEVGPRSILLLEDVDIFHSARERDDGQPGLSMAGLLNALDGVATPHGMISVLTTNDIGVIDEALLRPGRVDLREQIDLPDADQIERLWAAFYGRDREQARGYGECFKGSAATAAELFKQHMDNPEAALGALQTIDWTPILQMGPGA